MYQSNRKKLNNKSGMTMVELLAVVAIIVILAGVAFIAVVNYQRSMAQLERDAIAKEIFIAAQNHLTATKNENVELLKDLDNSDKSEPNKLTAGEILSEGYTVQEDQKDNYETPRYIMYNHGTFPFGGNAMYNKMLPFGSIDETVRAGGNYVICYQPRSGKVLDVFYCTNNGSPGTFNHEFENNEISGLLNLRDDANKDNKDKRRKLTDGSILGWYGGEGLEELGTTITAPKLKVVNGNRLYAEVWDPDYKQNDGISSRLVVKGKTSGAKAYCDLTRANMEKGAAKSNLVVLDDITQEAAKDNLHFSAQFKAKFPDSQPANGTNALNFSPLSLFSNFGLLGSSDESKGEYEKDYVEDVTWTNESDKTFVPGEDLEIKVISYCSNKLANIAESGVREENSLFADIVQGIEPGKDAAGSGNSTDATIAEEQYTLGNDKKVKVVKTATKKESTIGTYTVYINNIRHLENLDSDISGIAFGKDPLKIEGAVQTKSINWEDYATDRWINSNRRIYARDGGKSFTYYKPITMGAVAFVYNGMGFALKSIQVEDAGPAGVFGKVGGTCDIRNLQILDANIKSTDGKDAGALAGSCTNTTATNVIARATATNSDGSFIPSDINDHKVTSTESGSVGGLIGSMEGGALRYCASNMVVEGKGAVGGLVGSMKNTGGENNVDPTIRGCYSAGHTKNGSYSEWVEDEDKGNSYDVTGPTAGGLIGTATNATITDSYSTCSVEGSSIAGGFVGTADGLGKISNCYATGLLKTKLIENNATVDNLKDSNKGAFAQKIYDTTTIKDCKYFDIINEVKQGTKNNSKLHHYLGAVEDAENGEVKAIDESTTTYNGFVGAQDGWGMAKPCDSKLKDYYNKTENEKTVSLYPLKTIQELNKNNETYNYPDAYNGRGFDDKFPLFVKTHYGDWPAPEIFVINKNN